MAENAGYYDIGGLKEYGILIQRTVPVELVARIIASIMSFDLQTTSVDYQLKTNRNLIEEAIKRQHMEGNIKGAQSKIEQLLGQNWVEKFLQKK